MRFEIFQDVEGKWRWNAKFRNGRSAGNGGEGFASERNVRLSIERFIVAIFAEAILEEIEIRVVKRRK